MKYHLEIVNSLKAGSVDNVHIYCMFEATDLVENMRKVWLPYHDQIKKMYQEDFLIFGKGVQIFLGGDYHFLDDNLGHQGSSATYPSSNDEVLLNITYKTMPIIHIHHLIVQLRDVQFTTTLKITTKTLQTIEIIII